MLLCDIGNTTYHFLDGDRDYKEDAKSFNPSSVKERIFYIYELSTRDIVGKY